MIFCITLFLMVARIQSACPAICNAGQVCQGGPTGSCQTCAPGMVKNGTGVDATCVPLIGFCGKAGDATYSYYGTCAVCDLFSIGNAAKSGCENCGSGLVKYPQDATTANATCIPALANGTLLPGQCGFLGDASYAYYGRCAVCEFATIGNPTKSGCVNCGPGLVKYPQDGITPNATCISAVAANETLLPGQCGFVGDATYSYYGRCAVCDVNTIGNPTKTGCMNCDAGFVKFPQDKFSPNATCIPAFNANGTMLPGQCGVLGDASYAQYGRCSVCQVGMIGNPTKTGCDHCPAGRVKFPQDDVTPTAVCINAVAPKQGVSDGSCGVAGDATYAAYGRCSVCDSNSVGNSIKSGCVGCPAGFFKYPADSQTRTATCIAVTQNSGNYLTASGITFRFKSSSNGNNMLLGVGGNLSIPRMDGGIQSTLCSTASGGNFSVTFQYIPGQSVAVNVTGTSSCVVSYDLATLVPTDCPFTDWNLVGVRMLDAAPLISPLMFAAATVNGVLAGSFPANVTPADWTVFGPSWAYSFGNGFKIAGTLIANGPWLADAKTMMELRVGCGLSPQCIDGQVYVKSYSCPGVFSTSGLPASLSGTSYGRCLTYNDANFCGDWAPGWTSNLVANGQGQLPLSTSWIIAQGNFTNLGPGQGFGTVGTLLQGQPYCAGCAKFVRKQTIDLEAFGVRLALLDTNPSVLFNVTLAPFVSSLPVANHYLYSVQLLDESQTVMGILSNAGSGGIVVSGPTKISQMTTPIGSGKLRYIVLTEQTWDEGTNHGPNILNVGIYLNRNECQDIPNGGCHPQRECVDRLTSPALCLDCAPANLYANSGNFQCSPIDQCLLLNPCSINATCVVEPFSLNPLGYRCVCRTGYYSSSNLMNASLLCVDIDECRIGNDTNGGCGVQTCFNVIGASTSVPVCLAVATSCSLKLDGSAPNCGVVLPDNGSHNISIGTTFSSFQSVSFGPTSNPTRFPCQSASLFNGTLSCILPPGAVGRNLSLTVVTCQPPNSSLCFTVNARSGGQFSYPDPIIFSSTLYMYPGGSGNSSIVGITNSPTQLAFRGSHFLNGSLLPLISDYNVVYANNLTNQSWPCQYLPSSTTTQVVCLTTPGFGQAYSFSIYLGSDLLARGSDIYSYPFGPVVTRVRGCPTDSGTGTADCPTAGGTRIVIEGSGLITATGVDVGGFPCTVMQLVGSTIECNLPPSTGQQLVTVLVGAYSSLPQIVSYAPPTITSLAGCVAPLSSSLHAVGCDRLGSSNLTISGQNFGNVPPTVFISATLCYNLVITVPHSQVVCNIPPGNGTYLPIIFVQHAGPVATPPPPLLSYYQCPSGQFASDVLCLNCQAGTYSPSGTACLPCPAGQYSLEAATICIPCQKGTYTNTGQTCLSCTPGKYQESGGQSACLDCPSGKIQPANRSISCNDCAPGTYQDATSTTTCIICAPAKYSDFYGFSTCSVCSEGTFNNGSGATECTNCPVGFFQARTGQLSCDPCGPGTHAAGTGMSRCDECESGTFSLGQRKGTVVCTQCPLGFSQPNSATSSCNACAPGLVSTVPGQAECVKCLAGSYSLSQATACSLCQAGTSQHLMGLSFCNNCTAGKYSAAGATVCDKCPDGLYSSSVLSTKCGPCPFGAIPDKEGVTCVCPRGSYAKSDVSAGVINCESCPKGTSCMVSGITEESLALLPGWWRSPLSAYYRCVYPELCLGGLNNNCDEFRTGPLCGFCIPGYNAAGPGKKCAECPKVVTAWGQTIGIVVATLIIIIILFYVVLRFMNLQQRSLLLLSHALDAQAINDLKAETTKYEVDDAYFEHMRTKVWQVNAHSSAVSEDEESEPAPQLQKPQSRKKMPDVPPAQHVSLPLILRCLCAKNFDEYLNQLDAKRAWSLQRGMSEARRAPNFMYKVKILLGFLQIASVMPLSGGIEWPVYWRTFISAFGVFNFDFVPWESLGCATRIDYLYKATIVGFIPLVAILVIALCVYVSMQLGREDALDEQMERQLRQERAWRHFVKLVLFTVFLLYPFCSKMVLGIYNCVTIDADTYLVADFSVSCTSESYKLFAGLDFLFVLLYPIGVPVLYFFLLKSVKHKLKEPNTILTYGFLYDAYVAERWYWELLDMIHKLTLTSIVVFLPAHMVLDAAMLVMVVYMLLLLLLHPYIRKGDDRFHLLVQTHLFLIALVGMVLKSLDDPYNTPFASSQAMQILLSLLMIAQNAGLFFGFLIIAGRNVVKIFKPPPPKDGFSEYYY